MSITAAWRTEVGNGKQQSYYGWRPSKKKKEKRKSAERAGNSLEDQEGIKTADAISITSVSGKAIVGQMSKIFVELQKLQCKSTISMRLSTSQSFLVKGRGASCTQMWASTYSVVIERHRVELAKQCTLHF